MCQIVTGEVVSPDGISRLDFNWSFGIQIIRFSGESTF